MARIRPARKGGGAPEGGGGGGTPATTRRRQQPASPRPAPGNKRKDKAGTVTKSVQQRRGGARQFLSEVVAELRKVSWPTRPQLFQSTGVVLIVVAIVTAYLAVLDEIFARVVDSLF